MTTASDLAVLPNSMQNLVMQPPAELMSALSGNFSAAFEDFGGSFRSISLNRFQFTLKDAGTSTLYPQPNLPVVILGMAPDNHCVWYSSSYNAEREDQPTAVWWQKDAAPANVPSSVLVKDANGRNQYKICRRLVVAVMQRNNTDGSAFIDYENPYIMDIGSMSIYGKDLPDMMAFSLSGLIRFCHRNRVLPLHFITNIVFDKGSSVPAVRFVPAHNGGQLMFLPPEMLQPIYERAVAPDVADMLKVRLIPAQGDQLEEPHQTPVQVAPAQAPVQPQPTPVQAPVQPVQAPAQPMQAEAYATQFVAPAAPQAAPAPQFAPTVPSTPAPAPAAPVTPQPAPVVPQPAPQPQTPAAPAQQPPMQTATTAPQPTFEEPMTAEVMTAAAAAAAQATAMLNNHNAQPAQPASPQIAPAQPQPTPTDSADATDNALSALLAQAGCYDNN